jgi:hypothetical protein
MTVIAKTIVKDQLWVLVDGDRKIGNVEADESGYNVKIEGNLSHYTDTKTIERAFHVTFDKPKKIKKTEDLNYAKWPTSGKTYNNFFDVKRKLHVFTETSKSSCYHCAGYFKLNMNDEWIVEFCPKYIFIQRYEYSGPFMTREQAEQAK